MTTTASEFIDVGNQADDETASGNRASSTIA
jgi:hypothetical protein